ncbi:AAA family ATPase [Nafulsella turpanensis]|uniref:AAA family ATPase n=1 Tax=Nafulsella turpanensis TaxID=1265690 RepID=UPI00034D426F|nr:AAA family ATPase [Nafulsella turpanensis]
MKYWAFHCNPNAWDILSELRDHDTGAWTVNKQHKNEIQAGDRFVLWVSGREARVCAFGEVMEAPILMKENEDRVRLYAKGSSNFGGDSLRVPLSYSDKLIDSPLIKNIILNSYWLEENSLQYSFFDNPQGVISRELSLDTFKRLLTLSDHRQTINDFRNFLHNKLAQSKTAEEYLKWMPKIEKWLVEKGICDSDICIWNSKDISEINLRLENKYKGEWEKLNRKDNNRYSAPWNKWIEFNNFLEKKYWLYAPGDGAGKWDEFYEQGIMGLGWDYLGDLNQYHSKDEITKKLQELEKTDGAKTNDTAANYNFKNTIAKGDIIIVKKGTSELLGYGEVTSDYYYDESRETFQKCRKVSWLKKGNWKAGHKLVLKTLTDITKYPSEVTEHEKYYEWLMEIMNDDKSTLTIDYPLNTIFYGPPGTGKTYHTLLRAAEIVEGREISDYSEAQRIFNENLGDKIEFITFHQNYSYEDFIQGLRPDTENGQGLSFERKDGVFKRIADKALLNMVEAEQPEKAKRDFNTVFQEFISPLNEGEVAEMPIKMKKAQFFITGITNKSIEFRKQQGESVHTLSIATLQKMYERGENEIIISGLQPYYEPLLQILLRNGKQNVKRSGRQNYVIIIDEINRANISRVFGELITLIEPDKRSHGTIPLKCSLPSGEEFIVPSNLYIIGTMNTADKSIALLDIALRRRFDFEAMYPLYEIEGHEIADADILKSINEKIISLKGHDFQIGHAYFMDKKQGLAERMNRKVIPLLLEYFMNDEKEVKGILKSAGLALAENVWPLKISGRA